MYYMTINGAHAGDHHACTHIPAGGAGQSRDGILFIRPLDPTSSDSHGGMSAFQGALNGTV